jgi:enoyl-CoA hydratase/carnithine racemase
MSISFHFQMRSMLFRGLAQSTTTLARRYGSSTASLVQVASSENDQICRITLNNPRQRNILSLAMINDLFKAIETNEHRARVIVLTAGEQNVFSSGHSLKELYELSKSKACAPVFDRCTELMLK